MLVFFDKAQIATFVFDKVYRTSSGDYLKNPLGRAYYTLEPLETEPVDYAIVIRRQGPYNFG